jgi:hypothetical protein
LDSIWNCGGFTELGIVSTILSWRKAHTKVSLAARVFAEASLDDIGFIVWLQLIALNRGGSAIAVTAIGVRFDDGHGWSNEPSPTSPFKSVAIVGPEVPSTIQINHLASWYLDMA